MRGATYATSEVIISNGTVTSWDRGYDSNDKQVWGATKGPYVFKKVANPSITHRLDGFIQQSFHIGLIIKLGFDKESGLLIRCQVTVTGEENKEISIEFTYSEYSEFGGVKLPRTVAVNVDDKIATLSLQEMNPAEKLKDALFGKP